MVAKVSICRLNNCHSTSPSLAVGEVEGLPGLRTTTTLMGE